MKVFLFARRVAAVLVLAGMLAGGVAGCSYFEKPAEKPVVLPKSFVGIFEEAGKYGVVRGPDHYDLDEAVRVFAEGCCKTEEAAVRLLQRHWFKVAEAGKFCAAGDEDVKPRSGAKKPVVCGEEPVTPTKRERESGAYDKIYVAERQTDVLPYVSAYTAYRVMLFVKEGKVVKYRAARFVRDS